MKHTPGPWKTTVENCGGGLNIADNSGRNLAHTAECHAKDGATIYTDEAKANAKLIATAPTYYAIVEAILADETLTAEHIRNMLRPVQSKAKGK